MQTRTVAIISLLSIFIFLFISSFTLSHADDKSYSNCVAECKEDIMDLEKCIKEEKDYWDSQQTSYGDLRISCKQLIQNEKLNCKIDCLVEEIKSKNPSNRAVEFYEKNVKNFPNTNE